MKTEKHTQTENYYENLYKIVKQNWEEEKRAHMELKKSVKRMKKENKWLNEMYFAQNGKFL